MIKDIELILAPPMPHMVGDGFRMHNFIPACFHNDMRQTDPFIVMDYGSKFHFPPSAEPRGVGAHPHRGFETVTIVYKGEVEHRDCTGGGGVIGEGEVQWMTAGAGILHKEFHSEKFTEEGGDFQLVQLWVNLPAKDKMTKPNYQSLTRDMISGVELKDDSGRIEVIAGEYQGTKGPAKTFSEVHLMNAYLNEGGWAEFNFSEDNITTLLVIEGEIKVNDKETVLKDHFAKFANRGENFKIEALEKSVVLIMSGKPLKEPIAAHGPFVMNTKSELLDAFYDFNTGKFGYLEDEPIESEN